MKSRFDAALRALSAALPAALAAAGAASAAPASHDAEVVRAIGAGFTGAFRALDLVVAAPALLLPLGTRALRAGLASAVVTGICGAIAFDVARALVRIIPAALWRRDSPEVSTRLVSAVSAIAVLTALLAPAWQVEASAPGGAVTGALLVLLALRIGLRIPTETAGPLVPSVSLFVLGLAASYEPAVLVAALAALGPRFAIALLFARNVRIEPRAVFQHGVAFVLGLLPLALGAALLHRPPEIAVAGPMFGMFEEQMNAPAVGVFVSAEIGTLFLIACACGAGLSLVVPEARRIALALGLVVLIGVAAVHLKLPSSGGRFSAAVLAGLLAAHILGASALSAVVLAVARARVPFAEASAALVVVLELALPVRALDETMSRRDARAAHASSIWNDVAWGTASPASIVLVPDRGTMRRVASAHAAGQMRGDLVVVPAYDVQGRLGQRALLTEPKLAPLYRDVALGVSPEELSLMQLGAERAVLGTFDPKWDRILSRHLVPVGLMSRLESEPRGASDRKNALDAFLPSKERLVRISVAKKDAELAATTAVLLRARAIGMAATGERDLLARALDDLRAFAPDDPVAAMLVRRIVTTKGPIDVRDLSP